jgi:hypothetical protein
MPYTELSIVLLVLVIVPHKQLEGHAPGYGDCYVCSSTPPELIQSLLLTEDLNTHIDLYLTDLGIKLHDKMCC